MSNRAWPDVNNIEQTWKRIQKPLFELLRSGRFIYTQAHGGKWINLKDAIFDRLDENDPKELLRKVLLEACQNVATVPNHVLESVYTTTTKEITPSFVRGILKATPSCYRSLGRKEKFSLLKFVLKDDNFSELPGLELLPVSNGTVVSFVERSASGAIYITSLEHPPELLPGLKHRILDQDADEETLRKLEDVAERGICFDLSNFAFYKLLQHKTTVKMLYLSCSMKHLPSYHGDSY